MTVTLGMIGLGAIFEHHLAAISQQKDLRLAVVCDRDESRLRERSQQHGCSAYSDYRELLAEPPDAVVVALPHGLHCEAALAAIEAGCHVLVEKPMATNVGDCRRMLAAAAAAGRYLNVAEAASYHSGALKTGRRFRGGELGRFHCGHIDNVRFYFHDGRPAWFLDPAMSGGGMFANLGLHRLAMTRASLPGLTPASVSAAVSHMPEHPVEACTSAIVRYAEGGAMHFEEIGYFPKPPWWPIGSYFVFEEGMVAFDNTTWRMMTRDGRQLEESFPLWKSNYSYAYEDLLRAVRGEPIRGPGALEYAADTVIAQAAYASSESGREIDLTGPQWSLVSDR